MATPISESTPFLLFCDQINHIQDWKELSTRETQKTIKNLVEELLHSSSVPQDTRTKFIAAITFVNNQYQQHLGFEPFTKEIQQLKKSSGKEISGQTIKNKIGKLDLNSPYLNTEIKRIKEDLIELQKKGGISPATCNAFIEALEGVRVGYSLSEADTFFAFLASYFTMKFPTDPTYRIDLHLYENFKSWGRERAQCNLLQLLKQIVSVNRDFFTNHSIQKLTEFKKTTLEVFYQSLLAEYEGEFSYFNPKLTSNFHQLCTNYSEMQGKISDLLIDQFNKIKETCDQKSDSRFSTLFPIYPYLDCISKEVLFFFIENYSHLYLEKFWLSPTILVPQDLEKEIITQFNTFVSKSYTPKFRWLAAYAADIVQPYCQTNDLYTETEFGCCFFNCLERLALFFDNPSIEGKNIPMQCSSKSRFAHNKTRVASLQSLTCQNQETIRELSQVQAKDAKILHLKQLNEKIIYKTTAESHFTDLLFDKIADHEHDEEPFSFILALRCSKGGHAINIHLDPTRGIYRFIDDNLGICEFSDLDTLNETVCEYIEVYYPEMDRCICEFYQKIN